MNTPCPSYRVQDHDFLDDATVAADHPHHHAYPRIGRSRVLCPVDIHVDASLENAGLDNASQKNLLDLESDDENILGSNPYVFIEFGHSSDDGNTPEKAPYPDANSHSNYNLLTEDTQSFESWSKNIRECYTAANSHANTFQDSTSHRGKYDVPSDNSDLKNSGTPCDRRSLLSIANSHETYRILTSDSSDKTPGDNDLSREHLIPCEENSSYEIANSHSNYQIFYNSQSHHESIGRGENLETDQRNFNLSSSPTRSDSSRSSRSTEETSTTCDIEECLVQIEESLLNIEQNLLHVQDLDIPELKNLLYKSPSIERSLFEVQDLLCTENLESVKRGQLFSFNFEDEDDDGENLLDIISSKDLSPDSDHDTFTNDENLLQFNDEKVKENSANIPNNDVNYSMFYGSDDKNVNFIPNSLNRTPTRGRDFKGAGENIKSYSLDNGNFSKDRIDPVKALDVINDNLNSKISEKKLFSGKKCHSRTNSLDENTMSHNTGGSEVLVSQGKISFESLRFVENGGENCLEKINGKAKSDDTLENKSSYDYARRSKSSRRSRRKSKENRLAEVEAKTDEFRRKIQSIISNRQSIIPNIEISQKNLRQGTNADGSSEVGRNSQEKSPIRMKKSSIDKDQSNLKSNSFEKRKRKKTSRVQNPENGALVPSKLISLSLSLLLAALLQAVRCLTDLVEDAFRSVSYDRNGLLE